MQWCLIFVLRNASGKQNRHPFNHCHNSMFVVLYNSATAQMLQKTCLLG